MQVTEDAREAAARMRRTSAVAFIAAHGGEDDADSDREEVVCEIHSSDFLFRFKMTKTNQSIFQTLFRSNRLRLEYDMVNNLS